MRRIRWTLYGLVLLGFSSEAQDTIVERSALREVVVTGYRREPTRFTPWQVGVVKADSIHRVGAFNLADLLATEPGLDVMSTGIGVTKPVVRGSYGSRVCVLISGMKFDNQQWQDEHGMGLPILGLDRVEVIKGPMSILYGSEALAGVINTIEELPPPIGEQYNDFTVTFNSNTLGGTLQYGHLENKGSSWWRIRVGIENHGDYSDGRQDRVLNSRYDGYYLKATYGVSKGRWTSVNHFSSLSNRFGFLFTGVHDFIEPDARWSRALNENPTHLVFLNLLTSENTFVLSDGSVLDVNLGLHSNERMENEGGGAISLNMHLLTAQFMAKWEKDLDTRQYLNLSVLGAHEINTNLGSRKLVPNAHLSELNLSGNYSYSFFSGLKWESGLGFGSKRVATQLTPTVNDPSKEVNPFTIYRPYFNALTGIVWSTRSWAFKWNLASGVRVPNLAELSSDGLHEGIYTYEIGDPTLGNEVNLGFNADVTYHFKGLTLGVSPYASRYLGFIYLNRTGEDWFGFPVYRYRQQDAWQCGMEVDAQFTKGGWTGGVVYQGTVNQLDNGDYAAFIPAQKFKPRLGYRFKWKERRVNVGCDALLAVAQHNTAPEEQATAGYQVLNVWASVTWRGEKTEHSLALRLNNLLDAYYVDHLSRLKGYGVYQMGRNVGLNYQCRF